MALQPMGYQNWQELPLTDEEKEDIEAGQSFFAAKLQQAGLPEEVVLTLKLEFDKVSLTLTEDEQRTSPYRFADGEPFYRFQISGPAKDLFNNLQDPSCLTLWYLSQAVPASVWAGVSRIGNAFRGHIFFDKSVEIGNAVDVVAPYILNELKGPTTGPALKP